MGALRKGDRLLLADGGEAEIVAIELDIASPSSPGFKVYNFEVRPRSTYLVASNGLPQYVVVHNASGPCGIVTHSAYVAFAKAGKLEYVGRTMNFVRRFGEHERQVGRVIHEIATNLTYGRARALEQVLIDARGLTNLTNKINGIARRNFAKHADDLEWAYKWMRENAGDWF